MRRRRSSAARMSDVTGTRKRVRHQGTRTGEQLTISLADATRCEAWEFMNNASGLSLSNDTSAVTLFTKVKRAETTWRYDREDSMWDKLLSYRVTFFRLHFFFVTHNVLFCHAKSLTLSPFSKLYLFTASSLLHLTAFLNRQSHHERPQRPETTPERRRFAHAFQEKWSEQSE